MDTRTSSESLLDTLPKDIKQNVLYPRTPLSALGLLAQTSKQYEMDTAFLRLLSTTVDAEPESYTPEAYLKNEARRTATPKSYQIPDETRLASLTLLKRHPELLFKEGKVTDHFGRKIKASPYQLLLGAGDVWALKQVHEEIIAKIEDKQARAKAEAQAQAEFQAQFPDYKGSWPLDPNLPEKALYDERNKVQIEQVKAQLKIIVEKITADPCTNGQATKKETTEAIADLCKIFAPKKGEIIKTGLHFPLGILKEIGKSYDDQFNPWSGAQLAFFSREVIGRAEAALTAVDGQCVKTGLLNLDMKKGPDRRDGLFCRHPKGIPGSEIPLASKLGRTMFVEPFDGDSCFVTSNPEFCDWYNKKSGVRSWVRQAWVAGRAALAFLEDLWRTKAAVYGSCYAAEHKEVNTLSRWT